ncbi:heme o synthase [Sporolactobacillus sp. CPB3-1]|uniref:Protoheme IX farnesyltransferase n=1 Tax=Sporolactobacillus mangiferae TaxID=2940498 RepID=A0ABT0M8L1_9BACL|nr:heme o synthase [Sporolactobacillus mangiferae]MCL1630968.1 heme o synthase [Sporolactobacillus mangiferae]
MKKMLTDGQLLESSAAMPEKAIVHDVLTTVKIGIVNSNLMTAFTGVWLALFLTGADFRASLSSILLVLIGTAMVIAGGCSLNNFIDRDIDVLMERTQERPSATGKLRGKTVLIMGFSLSIVGLLALFAVSAVAGWFGLFGLLVYVLVYTLWLKRSTTMNTVIGSAAGAVPPIIGWAAIDPSLNSPVPWILFLVLFLWQPPHFLALAMKRVEEYRRAGIPMLPVIAGFDVTMRQMISYVAVLIPTSLLLYSLGPVYTIGASLLGFAWLGLAIYGLKTKETIKWAKMMFVYSLNYMTLLFLLMVISIIF